MALISDGTSTLVSQAKQAALIVAGKVSDIQYVYRDDIYTDVTITVSKTLKGQPNIDKDTVRLIEYAVKAPEAVALLEEKIRPIKDRRKPENQGKQKVESSEFLSMLESELTIIEAKIKETEKRAKE